MTENPRFRNDSELVVIVAGSDKDYDHCEKIGKVLDTFGVESKLWVDSAHKHTDGVLAAVRNFDAMAVDQTGKIIYIAVAGRSNALGGVIDGNTISPVINCPPSAENIMSSLDMPSGIAAGTVLYPEAAALFAVKIFALGNRDLTEKIKEYQQNNVDKLNKANELLQEKWNNR